MTEGTWIGLNQNSVEHEIELSKNVLNVTGLPERYEGRIVVFLGCSCSMHLIEIIHPLNRASGYFNQDFANLATLDRPVEKVFLDLLWKPLPLATFKACANVAHYMHSRAVVSEGLDPSSWWS